MREDTQRNRTKRSSFLRQLSKHAPELLREAANLREDGIGRFRQHYAPYFNHYEEQELLLLRDELRALWTHGRKMPQPLSIAWKQLSHDLEREPEKYDPLTLREFICTRWLGRTHGGILVYWQGRTRQLEPDPFELPALLTYCSLLCGDMLRVCRNRDCPAPYFVASRRDQRYCSTECAAPAKRAAKLRSWHKHKRKWPSQRKRAKVSRRNK